MIIVPNVLSSLVTLHNVKDLLEDGRRVCVRGGGDLNNRPSSRTPFGVLIRFEGLFTAENDPHQNNRVFSSVRRDWRVQYLAREHSGNCP